MAPRNNTRLEQLIEQLAESVAVLGKNSKPDDGPWWSRAVWQVGPTVVIVFILLFVMLGVINTPLQKIDGMEKVLMDHTKNQEEALKLWRTICRNTAKTENQKDNCEK